MVGEDGEGRGHVKEGREGLGEDLGFHSKSGCCWELSREPCILIYGCRGHCGCWAGNGALSMGSEREWGDQGPGCCSPPGDDGGQDQGQEKWDYSEIFEARVHRM